MSARYAAEDKAKYGVNESTETTEEMLALFVAEDKVKYGIGNNKEAGEETTHDRLARYVKEDNAKYGITKNKNTGSGLMPGLGASFSRLMMSDGVNMSAYASDASTEKGITVRIGSTPYKMQAFQQCVHDWRGASDEDVQALKGMV